MKHESLVEAAGITLTLLFQYITSNGTKLIIHFPMEQMGSNCTQILVVSWILTSLLKWQLFQAWWSRTCLLRASTLLPHQSPYSSLHKVKSYHWTWNEGPSTGPWQLIFAGHGAHAALPPHRWSIKTETNKQKQNSPLLWRSGVYFERNEP